MNAVQGVEVVSAAALVDAPVVNVASERFVRDVPREEVPTLLPREGPVDV